MKITGIQTGYLGTNTWIVPVAGSCGGAFFVTDPGGDRRDADYITKTLSKLAAPHSDASASAEAACAVKADDAFKAGAPLAFVMTHGHFDHVGALPFLHRTFPEAAIAIHGKDAAYLGAAAAALHIEDFTALRLADYVEQVLDGNPLPEATELLADGGALPFAPEWRIIHTPGHSPGSICLYNESAATSVMNADGDGGTGCIQLLSEEELNRGIKHILISGDTLFDGACGRTDLRGGSDLEMQHSLAKLERLIPEGTLILPGHGNPFVKF